jgi:four helix bundle protein
VETAKSRNVGPRVGAELEERTLAFAVRLVAFVNMIPNTVAGRTVGGQLLAAGTSIGANYREANRAESKADFAHKIAISLKESAEAEYWLLVCERAYVGDPGEAAALRTEANEFVRIFSSINRKARALR